MNAVRSWGWLRDQGVRARLVVAVLVVMVMALWLLGQWRGDADQVVRVDAPGSVGEDGATESASTQAEGEDGTVLVELPSVLDDEQNQQVEVGVPKPSDAPEPRDVVTGQMSGPVRVDEIPVEDRWMFEGELTEVEGRVQRKDSAGFWLVPRDDDADREGVFVAWGDENRGLPDGEVVVIHGLWRIVVAADEHLVAAGVEPGDSYLYALGWRR